MSVVFLIILLVHEAATESRKEKRLLLNDPGYYESRISHLESLTRQLQLQQSVQRQNSGATFVHWGSASCSNQTAETVYSGFAAGGWYNYAGSGTNYLCLPRDPLFGNGSYAVSGSYVNYLYGVEYETNFFGDKSQDEDAPCAVCQSTAGASILMIPGRNACYKGWTEQYKGYLASSYYSQTAQNEYVCVEEKA
ncbi:hypothetical protein FSP39_007088 [Pinctada imbricata]|uniref:Uncharacterized protein n=1 Tax=Pinctada imbricata TaxID=66713 RepID=A0AA89C3D1_PINIB|nr:hypothetical protein FSP39_007088 [Pinctada imbricata]